MEFSGTFYVTGVVLLFNYSKKFLKGKLNFRSTSRKAEYINKRGGFSDADELTQIRVGSVLLGKTQE